MSPSPDPKLWPDPSKIHPLDGQFPVVAERQPLHGLDASLFLALIRRADLSLCGLWRTAEVPDAFRARRDEVTGCYAAILFGPHAARFGSLDLYPHPFHECWPIVIVPTQMLVEAVEAIEELAKEFLAFDLSLGTTLGLSTFPRSVELGIQARDRLRAVGAEESGVLGVGGQPVASTVTSDPSSAPGAVASGVDGHFEAPSVVGGSSTVGNGGAGSDVGSAQPAPNARWLTTLELFSGVDPQFESLLFHADRRPAGGAE